jgi:hypothetical protein
LVVSLGGRLWRALTGIGIARWVAVVAAVAVGTVLVPSGVGSAATASDSANVTVSLDSPGAVTLDQFDQALGTLTSVDVSLSVDVLVQVCIENTGAAAGSVAAGSATGSLSAAFPGGAGATSATADASAGATQRGGQRCG